LVLPLRTRLAKYSRPSVGVRAWVMAMRCSAALTWRLPPRLSLNLVALPDQAGCGAVPFQRANALLDRNRRASAT
jgi:hypothetical protein